MVWCTYCQHENTSEATFCAYCGHRMVEDIVAQTGATIQLKPTPSQPNSVPDTYNQHYIPQAPVAPPTPTTPTNGVQNIFRTVITVIVALCMIKVGLGIVGGLFKLILFIGPFFLVIGAINIVSRQQPEKREMLIRMGAALFVVFVAPYMWWLIFPIMFVGNSQVGCGKKKHHA